MGSWGIDEKNNSFFPYCGIKVCLNTSFAYSNENKRGSTVASDCWKSYTNIYK